MLKQIKRSFAIAIIRLLVNAQQSLSLPGALQLLSCLLETSYWNSKHQLENVEKATILI